MKFGIWKPLATLILVAGSITFLFAGGPVLKRTSTDILGGPERYLGHVALDKPIYRPGETLYARTVVLNAIDHTPIKDQSGLNGTIEIRGPKGDIVANGNASGEDSTLGFSWAIPEGQSGGEYTMNVYFPWFGIPPVERKFDVRSFRAPRLKNQIVFLRDGYGPGEKVTASLHTERAEGGFPEGAKVTVSARVDGNEVHTGQAKVDREGNLTVSFSLPAEIERGEGSLSLAIEDGGIVETAAKTIPILLQTLDLQMFPEGGDLAEGVPCRVYVEARNLAQKPADFTGIIVDGSGTKVADVKTEHEGRGRFVFTPARGEHYALRIREPGSIKKEFPLPPAKEKSVALTALQDFVTKDAPSRFKIETNFKQTCFFTLAKRDRELDRQEITLKPGEPTEVTLKAGTACGVLTATLWDEKGNPLAERLIFREPANKVNVTVETAGKKHVPGGDVKLTIKTTDADGKPISANVGLTVTDETVLELVDKREQAPRLPAMVLLESDVKELMDAHVYLDGKNPKSPIALDLIMGTQGWRRFALVDATKFIAEKGDAARRVVALKMASANEISLATGGGMAVEEMMEDRMVNKADMGMAPQAAMPMAAPVAEPRGLAVPAPAPRPDADMAFAPVESKVKRQAVAGREEMGQALNAAEAKRDVGFLGVAKEMNMKSRTQPQRQDFAYIREFAFKARPNRKPGERSDFTETVFWNSGVKTDAKTGEAKIAFQLSDSVTSFKVLADAYDKTGGLGEGNAKVESLEPFSIEPKIPLEVSAGDLIQLPIGIINNHSQDMPSVTIQPTAANPLEPSTLKPLSVKAGERARQILPIYIGSGSAKVDLTLLAKSGDFQDKVTRKVSVKPRGFPIEIAAGGLVGPKNAFAKTISIPGNVLQGSLSTKAAVYPTPLANLTEALERLLCEPCGCFEQTSSTNYPLVMAQQYFLTHTGIPQEIVTKAKDLLDKGYNRLLGFECKKHGYEWFGEDPGHEALTAYGLLEFTDMAQVREVDAAMLQRTREWLMARRDMKGGFTRERRALHTWIENRDISNAYITWALLEAGSKGLDEEVSLVKTSAAKSKDSYVLALSANVLSKAGDKKGARELMEKLVKKQAKTGEIEGAETSITQSGGEALAIETTAFAILAWLNEPDFAGEVEKGMAFLAESCKGGRFSSTQATVLALRAIVAYDKARAHPKAPGAVQVFVDGNPVGAPLKFDDTTKGALILPEFGDKLPMGDHKVELKMTDGSEMPFSVTVNYYSNQPANSAECKLDLSASLKNTDLSEGSLTEANVKVANKTKDVLPMPVAIIGIPGGLEPRHDQLKELVKKQVIDAYEVMGRDVVLYWRGLKPEQVVEVNLSLTAAVPGTYEGPACRSYLYYTDEHKIWAAGMKATIKPRG